MPSVIAKCSRDEKDKAQQTLALLLLALMLFPKHLSIQRNQLTVLLHSRFSFVHVYTCTVYIQTS